jgi:hypothetical protein
MVTAMKSVKLQYVSSSRAVIFGVALLACMMVGQAMADESQAVRLSQTIEQSAGRTHEQQQEMLDLATLPLYRWVPSWCCLAVVRRLTWR